MPKTTDRAPIGRRMAMRVLAGGAGALALLSSFGPAAAAGLPGRDLIRAIVRSPGGAAKLAARLELRCGGPDRVEEIFAAELAMLRRKAAMAATPAQLAAELRQAVAADFAADRIFMLDGWVLARTELALYYEATGTRPAGRRGPPA